MSEQAIEEAQPSFEEQMAAFNEQMELYRKSCDQAAEVRRTSELEYDKMIIYMAGGGLVLTIGFVKDILKITETTNVSWLLWCWVGFCLALIGNVFSHLFAAWQAEDFLADKPTWKRKKVWVKWANYSCLGFVIAGISCFVVFILINLPKHGEEQHNPDKTSKHSDDHTRSNARAEPCNQARSTCSYSINTQTV